MSRVAVVTGGNKGIGYAIVKELCTKFDGLVYLTAPEVDLGQAAIQNLKKDGYQPRFHQLDITDSSSIIRLRDYLQENYGGLDVLVNNAAIAYKKDAKDPFEELPEDVVIGVNYMGTLNVCNILFPLLRSHARVVNISSSNGMLSKIPSLELKQKFASPTLTVAELNSLMQDFVNSAKAKTSIKEGWGTSGYNVSKVGVTALTFIQQRQFDKDPREDIIVNAVHPGYVNTDMTSHRGPLTPEQGAEAPTYLALLPANASGPKGQMVWTDKKAVEWGLNEKGS